MAFFGVPAPRQVYVGATKLHVQTSVTVGRFNKGAQGLAIPPLGLNLKPGQYFEASTKKINKTKTKKKD